MTSATLSLQSGVWQARVNAHGGWLTALRREGRDILRPAPDPIVEPTAASAFVMAPYPGRIANGRFEWLGQQVRPEVSGVATPHAIHGHSWVLPWTVRAQSAAAITLVFDWSGEGDQAHWPWAYRLEQTLTLTAAGLSVHLALHNRSAGVMPGGLGWHPYFIKDDAVLQVPASHRWDVDQQVLPTQRVALAAGALLRSGQVVAGCGYDHPFQCDAAEVHIHWPSTGQRVLLDCGAVQAFVVVFEHPEENCFCVEPVTQVPNAVNLDVPANQLGLRALRPDESMTLHCAVRSVTSSQTKHQAQDTVP